MTRKQYEKKVRQLQQNLVKYNKKTNGSKIVNADRVNRPNWGYLIPYGAHAGEVLRTYQQAWDMVSECLKGTDLLNGIY